MGLFVSEVCGRVVRRSGVGEEGGGELDVGFEEFGVELDGFVFDDGLGEADDVLDLAAVDVVRGEAGDVEFVGGEAGVLEEVAPDGGAAVPGVRLVVQRDRDAGVEGLVEAADAVSGEEHDAVVLLEQAQEDADHGVAVDVVVGTALEEDVGLVEQDDRVPVAGDLEDVAQLVLELGDGGPEFADCHGVERLAEQLGDGLGGERLAGARRPVQQEDAAAALAADDVLERALVVLDQAFDEGFALLREDQLVVGAVVVLDFVEVADGEFAPLLARERKALDGRPAAVEQVLGQVAEGLLLVLVVVVAALVGVHFDEGLLVDHAAAEGLVRDGRAPGLEVDVVGLGGVVRLEGVALELGAARGQFGVDGRVLGDELDVELVELLGVLELLDARLGLGVVVGRAVGLDDLHGDDEVGGAPAALVVALRHLARDEARLVGVVERGFLVQAEVQVQLVERDFLLADQLAVVREVGFELLQQEQH